MKTLKKVLCSMLTLALMVTMFAGSGMEVRAEEGTKTFEYQFLLKKNQDILSNHGMRILK